MGVSGNREGRGWLVLGGLGMLVAVSGGCGGEDGDSCGEFSACGGEVTGTWQIQNVCFTGNPQALFEGCMGAKVDVGGLEMTGNLTLGADMTFSRTSMLGGSMSVSLPSSCLTFNNITLTCSQLDAAVKAEIASDPDSEFTSISCQDASGGCSCTFGVMPDSEMETGTYTVQGNVLSLRETGEDESDTFQYCVSSDTLKLQSSGMAAMEEAVGGLIVLTKN